MAITRTFGGQTLTRPGSYSISQQTNNSTQIGSNDTLLIVGEAAQGAPGSTSGIVQFAAEQMASLIATYGSGPIVDCALAATRPSKDPSVSGAGQILVWKTNASTQATASVNEATNTNPLLSLADPAWGSGGNNKSITIANGTDTTHQKNITINVIGQAATVLGQNPATAVISIHYTGNASAATATISGSTLANKTLATTLTSPSDGSANLSIVLANYTVSTLVAYINAQTGYTAAVLDGTKAANPATDLDSISSTDIKTGTVSLYRLQQEIMALINTSGLITATLATTPVVGLPVNVTNKFLSSGALGASTNSNFSSGLSASLAKTYQQVVCAVSQDATADIALGVTDSGSTYTISSVQAALASHIALRSQVQNGKEAQAWTGFRSSTKSTAYTAAQNLGSYLTQMTMQDVLISDVAGNLTWKQPHVLAALLAGFRLGQAVGEPLTHKYVNINGFGHDVNPTTGISAGDFEPSVDYAAAINAGVTFLETRNGGSRVVVDNTTYGIDQSFVFNRGSVVEAALYTAINVRQVAEEAFIGKRLQNGRVSGGKISGGAADSIKNLIRQELIALWTANILGTSSDAPQGFKDDSTFQVTVQGNTCYVSLECKPIQGLDYLLITFTLGDISQAS